ncbi:MAG: hypothetical protein HY824_06875 [Acidobacteria bacterium]|nr:hypothetical protein [Acidobacteriota bacterium]
MRLAWFGPSPAAPPLDDSALLIGALRARHEIDLFTPARAHEFVWTDARAPYDLCVFELDNTPAHAFVWAYLLQYGGVLLLRALTLHDSRAQALLDTARLDEYVSEFAFNEHHAPHFSWTRRPFAGTWPMLRVPLAAARLAVVPNRSAAGTLERQCPDARVRYAPMPVDARRRTGRTRQEEGGRRAVTFGALASDRIDVAQRAIASACDAGAPAVLVADSSAARLLEEVDVMLSLQWPALGEAHTLALAAMASGVPLVTLETACSADWPALDPQTWQPRGLGAEAPAAISLDPRDEEHSLGLAVGRLAADPVLRRCLGEQGCTWWRAHATTTRAADAWETILAEAAALGPPPRPAGWPAHLTADGTDRARAILAEYDVSVDLF